MVLLSAFNPAYSAIAAETRSQVNNTTPRFNQPIGACEQTQPSTDSFDAPRTLWSDIVGLDTKALHTDSPHKPTDKMTSFCLACGSDSKDPHFFANPDVCTSAGLVANAYGRFRTQFWLDRALIWSTVVIPVTESVLLILLHAILGVARCIPIDNAGALNRQITSHFVDRACGLQLTSDVLRGETRRGIPVSSLKSAQLQHECYPFILLIVAVLMWIPHYLYHRATDKTARRDLCLVRSELHSFRRAVGRELNHLQISGTSMDGAAQITNALSPGRVMPIGTSWPPTQHPIGPTPLHPQNRENNSGYTTAATMGDASLLSQTPAPTVIPAQPPRSATLITNRGGLVTNPTFETPQTALTFNCGDADFSAPGLLDLPGFHACHIDWSLNTYLSAWQNTDYYWRRYLAKHAVLAAFQTVTGIFLFMLIGISQGAPFVAMFHCELDTPHLLAPSVCTLQTTFILNMSIVIWALLTLVGLSTQAIYFYSNFLLILGNTKTQAARYFGVVSRPTTFVTGLDETGRCFFADYIRLLAYAAFRDTHCEIRDLSVSYAPQLYRSDFHFISLLCSENAHLLPDAIHIHFWTERYARLCRRRFRRPYWAIRRGSLGHLVRCEDLSMKFNFSKIRIKVEVNDFGF